MGALNIDTLAASQNLRKRGFTEDQAIGVVEVLREIDSSGLATKGDIADLRAEINDLRANTKSDIADLRASTRADIADLKSEIREVEIRLEAKIEAGHANLKIEILRWLIVTQVALGGFIFAVLKFLK